DVHFKDAQDFRTSVKILSLAPEEFEKLKKVVKEKKETINSVLHTAMIFSAHHNLSGCDCDFFRTLTPISLRPYAKPKIDWMDIGNFISTFVYDYKFPKVVNTDFFNIDLQNFWKLCSDYRSKLLKTVPTTIKEIGLLNYLGKDNDSWEDFFKNKSETSHKGRDYSLLLSNLGKFPSDIPNPSDNCKIVDMIFTQSLYKNGPTVLVTSVCYDKKLYFSIIYQKGVFLDDGKVERFGKGMVECLRLVAKGNIE
ncbi:6773_t:CDS:1, partial [Diversispora eburnea]